MAERTVKVRLSAQVQEYISGMEKASTATRQVGSESEKLAQKKQAFQELGTAMTVVGGAITAVGVAALKTGIEYNTLQQTSRAALLTMLGSTEAVNAQMDKLDAFARTSPFAKQVFIEAQQQMLAFGIETEKVIPYLDAIQNAVAAAGGSNADIAELSEIFGKISATSKITAIDLQQFGRRGVNAAELIGSQMGKTGAEIREEITAGTLDADAALEALAAGMAEKFAGASDNVKETFAGAMDRVKAAWRDFGAELAKPLVDPEGGGMLVDFLNGLADAMRKFESLPEPLKQAITGVAGLTGAVLLLGGTALLAVPKIAAFKAALVDLELSSGRAATAMGNVAPAAIALLSVQVASGIADWIDEFRGVTVAADELTASLRDGVSIADDLVTGLSKGNLLAGLGASALIADNNLRTLNSSLGNFTADLQNSTLAKAMSVPFLGFGRDLGKAKEQVEELDSALAASVAAGRTGEAAAGFNEFAEMAKNAGWSVERIEEALPGYMEALEGVSDANLDAADSIEQSADAADTASDSFDEYAEAASNLASQVSEALDALNAFNGIGQSVETQNARLQKTFQDIEEHIAAAMEGVEGYTLSLEKNTVEGSANRAMLAEMSGQSQALAKTMFEQELATLDVATATSNYRERMGEGRQQLETYLGEFGLGKKAIKEFADEIYAAPTEYEIEVLIDETEAKQKMDQIEREINEVTRTRTLVVNALFNKGPEPEWQIPMLAKENEAGGMYKDGVEYFANGGIPTGMYKGGRTLYGFAEPGVPWEAFISGKPEARERSKEIWVETGNRLGMNHSGNDRPVKVYVQNPFTGKYLLGKVGQVANSEIDRFVDQAAAEGRRF